MHLHIKCLANLLVKSFKLGIRWYSFRSTFRVCSSSAPQNQIQSTPPPKKPPKAEHPTVEFNGHRVCLPELSDINHHRGLQSLVSPFDDIRESRKQ